MTGGVSAGVVIAGAGQAGFQTAFSLRGEGYEGRVVLIGEEPHIPYQRPPLSKDFLAGKTDPDSLPLRPETFYESQRIELGMGERIGAIDLGARSVMLASGAKLPFESLVLATGARNRRLTVPGAELNGICYLRTVDEAIAIQERLESARNVVIIGGGFIGLETAAIAAARGCRVVVVEAQSRVLARVAAPVISAFFQQTQESHGVHFALNAAVSELSGGAAVEAVHLHDGSVYAADLVVVGIGVVPNTELAAGAGLEVGNGIRVNEYLETAAPDVYAVGDCAWHPNRFAGGMARIESVQNAVDQARCVAATIAGKRGPYDAVPWFWTEQFDLKLQMAGLSSGFDEAVTRGEPASRKFSVFYYREGKLLAVDSVNRPGDHLAARKLLAAGARVTAAEAADAGFDLKAAASRT